MRLPYLWCSRPRVSAALFLRQSLCFCKASSKLSAHVLRQTPVVQSLARLVGARTVWVDSIANAEELSLSGQKASRIATLTLTQWPELGEPLPADPKARAAGRVYFSGGVV